MELFADLGVQTETQVVVQCELSVLLTIDCQFPSVQQLIFPFLRKLVQKFSPVYFLIDSPAPAQRAGKVVACA